MLHLFLISTLPVVFANPFQKYPYVFLLDVGNVEEIGKFSTQQIRLSIPGGSLAVRYPAVGEGDTIGHVRVSGIDFGTDLKASIIQGGPGYKYAVFVFMGNPGTPYDAVLTIQTIPNNMANPPNIEISNKGNIDQGLEDVNDSSEDTSDNTITETVYKGNKKQVMQSSSNVYHYTSNNMVSDDNFKYGVESQSEEDFHDEKGDDDDDDNEEEDDYKSSEISHEKNGYSDESSDDARIVDVSRNQYGIYEAFKPHWLGGVRFYPQASLYAQDSYGNTVSDEDIDERSESYYKDANNNIINDFDAPVEYK